jgi:DHA2 family multidrug resistance protein
VVEFDYLPQLPFTFMVIGMSLILFAIVMASAIIMVFCVSAIMQATGALLAPYLQKLAGFAPQDAGWAMAPRGVGIMFSMFVASRLGMRIDQRKLMACGLTLLGVVLYDMSTWTPAVSAGHMAAVMMLQGVSVGFVFNPMTVMAYTTLPAHLRGEATAVQSLARNIGAAIGIGVYGLERCGLAEPVELDFQAGRRLARGFSRTPGLV